MSVPAGMPGQMNGYQHPVSVDPYSYLSNLNMQGGMPPQMSAHAAYMSLPNNIVPNVNFIGGQNPGQQGSFMSPGISLGYAMRNNNDAATTADGWPSTGHSRSASSICRVSAPVASSATTLM